MRGCFEAFHNGKRRVFIQNCGNRHKSHIDHTTPFVAKAFDCFVVGCDSECAISNPEWAGGDPEANVLEYSRSGLIAQGVPPEVIQTEKDPEKAIHMILQSAEPGDLVVLLAEPSLALPLLKKRQAGDRDEGPECR